MKATASVLSARTADTSSTTVNCIPTYKSPVISPPRENGDAKERKHVMKNNTKMTPSKRHLHGRTNLQPSLLLKPTEAFKPMQQIPKFSPPLSEAFITRTKEKPLPPITRVDRPLLAPLLASSHTMNNVSDAIQHFGENSTASGDSDPAKCASFLLMADLIHVSVRYNIPQKLVARHLRRHRLRRDLFATANRRIQASTGKRRKIDYTLTRVRGNKNYGGQSCFLNSVLQALAALPSFLAYLERIVALQDERGALDAAFGGGTDKKKTMSLAECLLLQLSYLNGSQEIKMDPREILYRVGKAHAQFRPRHGSGRAHVGTEQQDAQELLQALLGMVIVDACLDTGKNVEDELLGVVNAPLDFSQQNDCEEQGSVLSLSGFLTRMDLEEQKKNEIGDNAAVPTNGHGKANGYATSKSNGHDAEENGHLPREEKKQEDFELDRMHTQSHYNGSTPATNKNDNESVGPQLSTSTQMMLNTLSPMTPSPLSGWIGSTLQCCTCHHVRPIQNAPFLDIPIVPTSLSSYLDSNGTMPTSPFPPCTVHQCLKDFCSVERVQDVECRSCTIRRNASQLEEEIYMLRGAVETVVARCRKRGESGEDQVKATRNELEAAEARYARLVNTDPDDGELEGENDDGPEEEMYLRDTNSRQCLIRGDAKKCLLLTRMPSVLCLHVQRRYYDPARNCMAKALQHIDFPQVLDLGPHCAYGGGAAAAGLTGRDAKQAGTTSKPIPYKLVSIIEHRGNAHAGHYQTYRRAPRNSASTKEWVQVSDLNVTPLHWRDVKRCQAYMLFYEAM